ncbi:hypothetical protein OH76DRAFT_1402805 [Lentinus brumalis]|uniref:Uncharacterized protein n=1 Tax=Lentinus brumalis TaxID=2498619 RepID=A0A371DCV0_9APHY|nr:hypothetical protein OH76DRAFT_1402805 [Polyporus brumalis]
MLFEHSPFPARIAPLRDIRRKPAINAPDVHGAVPPRLYAVPLAYEVCSVCLMCRLISSWFRVHTTRRSPPKQPQRRARNKIAHTSLAARRIGAKHGPSDAACQHGPGDMPLARRRRDPRAQSRVLFCPSAIPRSCSRYWDVGLTQPCLTDSANTLLSSPAVSLRSDEV